MPPSAALMLTSRQAVGCAEWAPAASLAAARDAAAPPAVAAASPAAIDETVAAEAAVAATAAALPVAAAAAGAAPAAAPAAAAAAAAEAAAALLESQLHQIAYGLLFMVRILVHTGDGLGGRVFGPFKTTRTQNNRTTSMQ